MNLLPDGVEVLRAELQELEMLRLKLIDDEPGSGVGCPLWLDCIAESLFNELLDLRSD